MTEFRYKGYAHANGSERIEGTVKANTSKEARARIIEQYPHAHDLVLQGENNIRNREQILAGDVVSRKPN